MKPLTRSDGGDLQDLNAETEMDRALRLQQQLFMSEFVQQVVSNQDSPSHFVPESSPAATTTNALDPGPSRTGPRAQSPRHREAAATPATSSLCVKVPTYFSFHQTRPPAPFLSSPGSNFHEAPPPAPFFSSYSTEAPTVSSPASPARQRPAPRVGCAHQRAVPTNRRAVAPQ